MSELSDKVKRAVRIIKMADTPLEVCYSGGKDSDVILALTQMAGVDFRAIYKNTTIDPPGTVAHAKEVGAEVMMPKRSFFEIVANKGFPSRWARFCCSELKEYKVLDNAVQGIRREESTKRASRYKEPVVCRNYPKGEHVNVFLPILDWTSRDIAEFVKEENIKCHSLYYDEQGIFHPERRLGCIGCPLATKKKMIEDFKRYPKFIKPMCMAAQRYIENKPHTVCGKKFKDGYEVFYQHFFDGYEAYEDDLHNLLGTFSAKERLEEIFDITL